MGRRRKRLIVQADLTSEEDREFLAWVLELRRKRRLSEEIRQALHQQFLQRNDRRELPVVPPGMVPTPLFVTKTGSVEPAPVPADRGTGSAANKLARLVGSF
ncbi:MAG TPA: hypothetical protein VGK74_13140 [Symbiobacteriaceae bacterium]|jgi:hypothetical protein